MQSLMISLRFDLKKFLCIAGMWIFFISFAELWVAFSQIWAELWVTDLNQNDILV